MSELDRAPPLAGLAGSGAKSWIADYVLHNILGFVCLSETRVNTFHLSLLCHARIACYDWYQACQFYWKHLSIGDSEAWVLSTGRACSFEINPRRLVCTRSKKRVEPSELYAPTRSRRTHAAACMTNYDFKSGAPGSDITTLLFNPNGTVTEIDVVSDLPSEAGVFSLTYNGKIQDVLVRTYAFKIAVDMVPRGSEDRRRNRRSFIVTGVEGQTKTFVCTACGELEGEVVFACGTEEGTVSVYGFPGPDGKPEQLHRFEACDETFQSPFWQLHIRYMQFYESLIVTFTEDLVSLNSLPGRQLPVYRKTFTVLHFEELLRTDGVALPNDKYYYSNVSPLIGHGNSQLCYVCLAWYPREDVEENQAATFDFNRAVERFVFVLRRSRDGAIYWDLLRNLKGDERGDMGAMAVGGRLCWLLEPKLRKLICWSLKEKRIFKFPIESISKPSYLLGAYLLPVGEVLFVVAGTRIWRCDLTPSGIHVVEFEVHKKLAERFKDGLIGLCPYGAFPHGGFVKSTEDGLENIAGTKLKPLRR